MLDAADRIARTYRGVLGDETVFERTSDVLQEERVAYEHVGAYFLGRDVAETGTGDAVLAPLCTLLAELVNPMSGAVEDVLASSGSGPDHDRETIVSRHVALQLGPWL